MNKHPMAAPVTYSITIELTRDELEVISYIINVAGSSSDPLKDVYELGDDEPEEPYEALRTGTKKFNLAAKPLFDQARKPGHD